MFELLYFVFSQETIQAMTLSKDLQSLVIGGYLFVDEKGTLQIPDLFLQTFLSHHSFQNDDDFRYVLGLIQNKRERHWSNLESFIVKFFSFKQTLYVKNKRFSPTFGEFFGADMDEDLSRTTLPLGKNVMNFFQTEKSSITSKVKVNTAPKKTIQLEDGKPYALWVGKKIQNLTLSSYYQKASSNAR